MGSLSLKVSLKMFPKGYNKGTISYVERNVPMFKL